MTVKELLEELRDLPKEQVILVECDADYWDIKSVRWDERGAVAIIFASNYVEPK